MLLSDLEWSKKIGLDFPELPQSCQLNAEKSQGKEKYSTNNKKKEGGLATSCIGTAL
jgi:hypothetical protein